MPPRLTGKNGAIYLAQSTTKLADSYSWEFEATQDMAECSVKGEPHMHYVPNVSAGRVRIQSFLTASSPLTGPMIADRVNGSGVGIPVNFALFALDTDQSTTSLVLGNGWLVRSQLHVARDGIITDELEIQVEDTPFGVD